MEHAPEPALPAGPFSIYAGGRVFNAIVAIVSLAICFTAQTAGQRRERSAPLQVHRPLDRHWNSAVNLHIAWIHGYLGDRRSDLGEGRGMRGVELHHLTLPPAHRDNFDRARAAQIAMGRLNGWAAPSHFTALAHPGMAVNL